MSIANNIDYGVLSRINVPLEQPPSELEVALMSTVRLCHMATKFSSKDGKGGLKRIPRVTIKPHRLKKTFSTARGGLSLFKPGFKPPPFFLILFSSLDLSTIKYVSYITTGGNYPVSGIFARHFI